MGGKTQKNPLVKSPLHGRQKSVSFSRMKWVVAIVLLVAGIAANTYFSQVEWTIRTAIGIVLLLAVLGIISQTSAGQIALGFAKAARIEVRKVVWPTRQETVQTTLVVVAMVVFSAIVLWGLDTLFYWLVGWLAGQRG